MLASRASTEDRAHTRRAIKALVLAGVVLAVLLAGMLATPTVAHAEIPVIGPVAKTVAGIGEAILNPGEAVLKALLKILQAIFGGLEAKLITGVIEALLNVPSFRRGNVATLEHTTVAIAAGMLSAVLTLSIVRYYLAGLSDSGTGGFEALQGVVRVAGAVGFIILWPGIFGELVRVPVLFNGALLDSSSVQHNVALLFDAALVLGASAFAVGTGVGLIFVILIALAGALVFIALLWMKILLAILLMFLYVSMPLAVVLWPVPELSWIAASALRTLAVSLIVPCVWAILFALSAAINADILTWVPTHSILNTLLVRPLAGLTLMVLCITIPRALMQAAIPARVPHPGGRVWRTATLGLFAFRGGESLARSVAGAAGDGNQRAQAMISRLPSSMQPPRQDGDGGLAARVLFGRSGYEDQDHPRRAGRGGSNRDRGAAEPGAEVPPEVNSDAEAAIARTERQVAAVGIQRPSNDSALTSRAREAMRARSRIAPPNASEVAAALGQFAPETQRDLARIGADHGLREFAAEHLRSPSLTVEQRDALSTLGSARMQTLQEGINVAQDRRATPQSTASGTQPHSEYPGGRAGTPGPSAAEPPRSSPPTSAATVTEPAVDTDSPLPTGASQPTAKVAGRSPTPPTDATPSAPAAPGSPQPGEIRGSEPTHGGSGPGTAPQSGPRASEHPATAPTRNAAQPDAPASPQPGESRRAGRDNGGDGPGTGAPPVPPGRELPSTAPPRDALPPDAPEPFLD